MEPSETLVALLEAYRDEGVQCWIATEFLIDGEDCVLRPVLMGIVDGELVELANG